MPDFGQPVAQNINTNSNATQGLQTLSQIMNMQRLQQSMQIGAQQLQILGADAQQANQQKHERVMLQNMMQSGKDPDGNPIKDENGEINAPAFAAAANKYLTLTGQGVTQSIIQTMDNRLKLNDSVRHLGQNYRNDVSGIVRSAIGTNQTPQAINAALDTYAQQNPNAAGAIMRAKALVQNLNPNVPQAQRDQALMHLAQEFQPAQTTELEQVPSVGTITGAGGGVQGIQTNPLSPVPMGAVGPEVRQGVSPAQKTQVGINPLTGQPYVIGGGPSGGTGAPSPAPAGGGASALQARPGGGSAPSAGTSATGWPRLPAFPTPQQANSATAAATEADSIRSADSNPVSGYGPTKQVYSNLLGLVAKNPAIGPKSGAWNQVTGALTPFGASANSTMQEVDSYLDRLALQNAGAAGLSTDAARHMSAVAAGTTEMNPEALKEKLRFGAATLEASHAYRQGLDKVIGTGNENPIAKRAFDSAWTQNADINAFRLLAAKNNGDKEGYEKTLAQINALPEAQRAMIKLHMTNLNMLAKGQMPQ